MSWKTYIKYLSLPLLVAASPVLFLFGHNASILSMNAIVFPLGASLLVAWFVYTLFCLFQRRPLQASLAAALFVVFYYLYGSISHQAASWKILAAQPYILLVIVIAVAAALSWLVTRIRPAIAAGFQRILLVVAGALVIYNLFGVTVPSEAQKLLANLSLTPAASITKEVPKSKPDIYYIVFDEYAGFDAIREYWHDDYVDGFESFLKKNNFFLASGSRSVTINTGAEIASRLNLQPFATNLPTKTKNYYIDNNKVMQTLKAYGYTTVAIDMFFQGITADDTIQYDPKEVGEITSDAFQKLYLDTTMFNPFSGYFLSSNQKAVKQRDLINYSLEKTLNPGDIQGPKFVYTHILLPHEPFIFDANGNLLSQDKSDDWGAYLGQHKYATKLAQQLISKLLAQSNPNNPPVIILQSDHGARNLPTKAADGTIINHLLPKYDMKYSHYILNALYLPGFDTSTLSTSFDPTETFAIVLNHYLGTQLTMNHTPAKP